MTLESALQEYKSAIEELHTRLTKVENELKELRDGARKTAVRAMKAEETAKRASIKHHGLGSHIPE